MIEASENAGFAANVNRGLRAAPAEHDVVVLNSDMVARPGWLACLQYAASRRATSASSARSCSTTTTASSSPARCATATAPEWFDHRYRFRPADWGPANVAAPVLAVTGACMYIKREVIERTGLLDERYPMAYEDVDYCLRAWQAGFRVIYWPDAELVHLESVTRGTEVGERERAPSPSSGSAGASSSTRATSAPPTAGCA